MCQRCSSILSVTKTRIFHPTLDSDPYSCITGMHGEPEVQVTEAGNLLPWNDLGEFLGWLFVIGLFLLCLFGLISWTKRSERRSALYASRPRGPSTPTLRSLCQGCYHVWSLHGGSRRHPNDCRVPGCGCTRTLEEAKSVGLESADG